MRYDNAALLHEGGTTSSIAAYLYFTGKALKDYNHTGNVYVITQGWKHLCGDKPLEEGKHYLNFSNINVDPSGRANPMGTSRKCPVPTPKQPDANYIDRVVEHLKALKIGVIVTKGGDDERWIDANLTSPLNDAGIRLVPQIKTIDIDVKTETLYKNILVSDTPGARSAIVNIGHDPAIKNLKYEALDGGRVFVVGVMGRNCGELALAVASQIGADHCIIPEFEMTSERIDNFMGKIKKGQVIVVSEGARWWNAQDGKCTEFYVCRPDEKNNPVPIVDEHGRKMLGKAHEGVASSIEKATGIEARIQSTDYMGRTGPPFKGDISYERALAGKTIELIDSGMKGVMPAPRLITPYDRIGENFHMVELPTPDLGYDEFKKRITQPFNADVFYDGENFKWTPQFQRLVEEMLTAE